MGRRWKRGGIKKEGEWDGEESKEIERRKRNWNGCKMRERVGWEDVRQKRDWQTRHTERGRDKVGNGEREREGEVERRREEREGEI